jgi:hypothetical protein
MLEYEADTYLILDYVDKKGVKKGIMSNVRKEKHFNLCRIKEV